MAQLERVGELIERKRQIFDWYQQRLGNIEGLTLNYEASGTKKYLLDGDGRATREVRAKKGCAHDPDGGKRGRLPSILSPAQLHPGLSAFRARKAGPAEE